MSTAVETAFPPLPDGKGNYIGEVLSIYGCATHCELWPDLCWLCGKSGTMLRLRLGRFCESCKTMKPHVHGDDFNGIYRTAKRRDHKSTCYSGHLCEIADLSVNDLKILIDEVNVIWNKSDLFQTFTHRPMEFYAKYAIWPKNVWCMGTFTSGEIAFPPELECGVRVAYVEPVMGQLYLQQYDPGYCDVGWLVIGLLNHADYAKLGITLEQLSGWVKALIADADTLNIPIFCKSHKLWAKLGIEPRKEWPK